MDFLGGCGISWVPPYELRRTHSSLFQEKYISLNMFTAWGRIPNRRHFTGEAYMTKGPWASRLQDCFQGSVMSPGTSAPLLHHPQHAHSSQLENGKAWDHSGLSYAGKSSMQAVGSYNAGLSFVQCCMVWHGNRSSHSAVTSISAHWLMCKVSTSVCNQSVGLHL